MGHLSAWLLAALAALLVIQAAVARDRWVASDKLSGGSRSRTAAASKRKSVKRSPVRREEYDDLEDPEEDFDDEEEEEDFEDEEEDFEDEEDAVGFGDDDDEDEEDEMGFDAFEDDEAEMEYVRRPKPSRRSAPSRRQTSRRRPPRRSSRGQLVSYGYKYRHGPSVTERVLKASKDFAGVASETLGKTASKASKQTVEAMLKVQRQAKERTSSDFEKLLLRATSPDDAPVATPDMQQLFAAVRRFPRSSSRLSVNPWEKTLHKLWNKVLEKDWRTTTKGIDILHRISRDARPKDAKKFAEHIKSMRKARYARSAKKKILKHRYFDVRSALATVDDQGAPYLPFIKSYYQYVMTRMRLFTGRFNELKAINDADKASLDAEKVSELLKNARMVTELGLKLGCIVPPKRSVMEDPDAMKITPVPCFVVCDCTHLVADDLLEIWKQVSMFLKQVLMEDSEFQLTNEEAIALLEWWTTTRPRLELWRRQYKRSLASIKIRVKEEDLEQWLDQDTVNELLEQQIQRKAAASETCAPEAEEEKAEVAPPPKPKAKAKGTRSAVVGKKQQKEEEEEEEEDDDDEDDDEEEEEDEDEDEDF